MSSGTIGTSSSVGTTLGAWTGSYTPSITGENLPGEANTAPIASLSADVLVNRTVTATSISLGRVFQGTSVTGDTTLATQNPGNGDLTDASNTRVSFTSNATTLNLTGSVSGGSLPVTITVPSVGGSQVSSSVSLTPTSLENPTVAGQTLAPVSVGYTAYVLAPRVLDASTTPVYASLGNLLVGAPVSSSVTLTSPSGDDNSATRVNVASGSLGNGLTAAGTWSMAPASR